MMCKQSKLISVSLFLTYISHPESAQWVDKPGESFPVTLGGRGAFHSSRAYVTAVQRHREAQSMAGEKGMLLQETSGHNPPWSRA